MNQYFYLITVQTLNGPASMAGVTVWEHGATRQDIYTRIRDKIAEQLKVDPENMPVISFTLERNT